MANPNSYRLRICGVNQIVWNGNRFNRFPNLYVEVRLKPSMQRTRVVKHNMSPTWDEVLPLSRKDSSILHLSVKHETSNLFTKNPSVGCVDIELDMLLRMCKNDQCAHLELKSMEGRAPAGTTGFITVQLVAVDIAQTGAIAVSNARRDIDHSGILASANKNQSASLQAMGIAANENLNPDSFLTSLHNIMSKLDVFVQIVDNTSKVHPYASFAWQVIASLYNAVKGQMERDEQLVKLVVTMESVYSFVDAIQSLPDKLQLLEDIISQILKQTVECAIFIREYTGRGFAGRVATQALLDPSQTIREIINSLEALKQHFDSGITLQVAFVSSKTLQKVEKLVAIENLKLLSPARMDAFSRPECLPETRQGVLKWVTDWLTTPSNGQNILWLHGLAGSGKSTISTTIAEYFRELARLAAFIFFDRADPTNSEPSVFVRTLSYKLACFDHVIQATVCESIERDSGITQAPLRVQFAKLLLEPLAHLNGLHAQGPVVIIIDALDECGDHVSRKELLRLLARELAKFPPAFRFLITSRREPDIEGAFLRRENVIARELDITDQANDTDISSYIHHHMSAFRDETIFQLSSDWPGEERLQALARSSAGLFIWASTAVKFIAEGYHPDQQLAILLRPHPREAESPLDVLYETALSAAGQWDNDYVAADFRAVLGIVVIARVPLSDTTIDGILGLDGYRSSRHILTRLRCLLHWTAGQLVRASHASFPDYLTDRRRCGSHHWAIDVSLHHRNLALACFRTMRAGLRFNICELGTSHLFNDDVCDLSDRINNHIPVPLSYACRFWADHLQETDFEPELRAQLDEFFRVRFLYWLEVLSLIQEVDVASQSLLSAVKWTTGYDEKLGAFAVDANCFVSTFKKAISGSAPHIYISAVPFAPIESLVSKQYINKIPRTLSIDIGRRAGWDWTVNTNVLEGHTGTVTSVAFSPDSKQIVSGSNDGTVRVWDTETAKVVSGPFEGHAGQIRAVAFSANGRHIVSGSVDQTVMVWDTETGNVVLGPLKGHAGQVWSVALSPNGSQIVSGSEDLTVRVWDAETGKVVAGPFKGHTSAVSSVAFSPDGKQVVSGSADHTVRVWKIETGEMVIGPFEGHADKVWSVAFSPDGKRIASGSSDRTVLVWDTETGNVVSGSHAGEVWSVAFSPDGKHIVSGSEDQTIRVWDSETGKMVSGPFEGHTGQVWTVAFSPDGKQIVSGSADQTVRIWDPDMGKVVSGSFEGHMGLVTSVAFSPDNKHVVSGSSDRTVRMWDAETGKVVSGPFAGHASAVWSVSFSPNGKRIVSGSMDQTVRVWDVETGKAVSGPFEGHTDHVRSVAFSPEGKKIVSGSSDKTVRVWDAETGHPVSWPFEGPTNRVSSVAFSPDGKHIISGSSDWTVRVWDVETGTLVSGPLKGHTGPVCSVAFSPNGNQIVSGSSDRTIKVWTTETGEELSTPFEGHTGQVWSVGFSPGGKQIISGSEDQTIRVWDTETGEVALGPLKGHTGQIWSVAFSADGSQIVSGSEDQTLRVWDAETGNLPTGSFESSATLPPDSKQILSGSSDQTVLARRLVPGRVNSVGSFPSSIHNNVSSAHFNSVIREAGFCDASTLVNGWMLGSQSEVLFWVPHYHRQGLWWPRNTAVIGRRVTKLNFRQFVHGTSWTHCGQIDISTCDEC